MMLHVKYFRRGTMEKIKLVKEKKEKVREEEYRELIKNTIMRYVRSNKAEDCTRTNLLTYVANDDKVQDARKKRYRSKRSKKEN